jgi:flagellar protein FliS
MNPQAAQQYLRTRVLTATPEQLQLMLYDGALRFGQQAKIALQAKNYAQSYKMITRIEGIITELSGSMKRDVAPELCGKLSALYNFAYRKLIEAKIHHKVDALDEAMEVLKYQRETWVLLMNQLTQAKAQAAATRLDIPEPNPAMEASISMQG